MNFVADYQLSLWNFDTKFIRFGELVPSDWIGEEDVYDPKIITALAIAHTLDEH